MPEKFIYLIVIHYSEIALKGKNRKYFENLFINNIRKHIHSLKYSSIKLYESRILINDINKKDWERYKKILLNVMGLENFILMIQCKSNLKNLEKAAAHLIKDKSFENFRVTAKRNYKKLPFTSQDTNIIIGEYIQQKSSKPVNLDSPDLNVYIELLKDFSFIGVEKFYGFSGLPANCQEKALSLISSGIDSPVASFEMLKRGVTLDYIHFHSYPAINKQSINNVKKILTTLNNYQLYSTLYLVPLLSIQKKIMETIPDKYWVIFFRRYMVKIANDIAHKYGAIALVSGESVGQVASQTLSNIRAIDDVCDLPIIRPLSGLNKEEIIRKAKKINTYDISIEPYEDCCSFFVPPHPETKAKMDIIDTINQTLVLDKLYQSVLDKIEVHHFKYNGDN
tara:strand:+ start:505 stop:1689 length:1185 start_codon:yes stop_codon:yes gene_type:complete